MAGLVSNVRSVRPILRAMRGEDASSDDGQIAVVGDDEAARAVRDLLGIDGNLTLPLKRGLLVGAATPGSFFQPTVAALARRKDKGGPVLGLLVGTEVQRARLAAGFLEERPLEASDLGHVARLDRGHQEEVRAVVAKALDAEAVAAGHRYPALRAVVGRMVIVRSARQAGLVGVSPIAPGADMPAIALIQVKMVAQLAALYGRPLGGKRALEIAGTLALGMGWRALARRAVGGIPFAGWAIRGAIAYAGTQAVGEAVRTWFADGGALADDPVAGLRAAIEGAVGRETG